MDGKRGEFLLCSIVEKSVLMMMSLRLQRNPATPQRHKHDLIFYERCLVLRRAIARLCTLTPTHALTHSRNKMK